MSHGSYKLLIKLLTGLSLVFFFSCSDQKPESDNLPLEVKASNFLKQAEYDSSFKYYSLLIDSLGKTNPPLAFEKSLLLGNLYVIYAKFNAVDTLFADKKINFVTDSSDLAKVYRLIGERYYQADQPAKADSFFRIALNLRGTLHPADSLSICESLNDMANVYTAVNKFDKALELMNKCSILLKNNNGDKRQYGGLFFSFGNYYYKLGEYKKAYDYYTRSQHEFGALNDAAWKAKVLNNIGNALFRLFETEKALDYFNNALDIKIKIFGPDHLYTADTQNNLGLIYDYYGEPDRAVDYYSKALQIRQKYFGNESRLVGRTFTNLANALKDFGDYAKAESLYISSIRIFEKINSDDPDIAIVAINLSEVLAAGNNFNSAIHYLKRADKILRGNFGNDHLYVAITNLNLSISSWLAGNKEEAAAQLNTALKTALKTSTEPNPIIAEIYSEYGFRELSKKNYRKSLYYYQKALNNIVPGFRDTDFLSNPDSSMLPVDSRVVSILTAKANVLMELNSSYLEAAYSSLGLAVNILDNIRLGFKEESSKLLLGREMRKTYESAISVCYRLYSFTKDKKYIAQAFKLFEKSKSAALLNKVVDSKAKLAAGIPDSLLEKERELKIQISSLQVKLNSVNGNNESSDYKNKIFLLKQQYLDLIKIYEEQFPVYYNLKYNPGVISVHEFQKDLLKQNETCLQYFLTEKELYTIIVSKNDVEFIKILPDFDVKASAADYRVSMIESNYSLFTSSAYKLYKILVKPVKKYITGDAVIIVPDGILNMISFDTLIDNIPETRQVDYKKLSYLIYQYRTSYTYSCSLLKENISFKSVNEMNNTIGFAPY